MTAPPMSHAYHVTSLPAHSQLSEHRVNDHMTTLPGQPPQENFTNMHSPSCEHHLTSHMMCQSSEHHESDHMTTLPTQPLQGHSPSHEHHMVSHMTRLPAKHPLLSRTTKESECHSSTSSVDMQLSSTHFNGKDMKGPTRAVIHPPNFNSLRPCTTSCNPDRDGTKHSNPASSTTSCNRDGTRHSTSVRSITSCNSDRAAPRDSNPVSSTSHNPDRAGTRRNNPKSSSNSTHQQTAHESMPFQTGARVLFPSLMSATVGSDSTAIKRIPSSIYMTSDISPSGGRAELEQNGPNLKVDKMQSSVMNSQLRQPTSSRSRGKSLGEASHKEKLYQNSSSVMTFTCEPLPQWVVDTAPFGDKEPQYRELAPAGETHTSSVLVDSCTQTFSVESRAIQTDDEMVAPGVGGGGAEQRLGETCRKCQVEVFSPSALAEDACAFVRVKDENGGGGANHKISHDDPFPLCKTSRDSTLLLHDLLPSAVPHSTKSCVVGGDGFCHTPTKLTQSLLTTDTVGIGPDTLFASSLLNANNCTHDLHHLGKSSSTLEESSHGQGEYGDVSLDRLGRGGVKVTR